MTSSSMFYFNHFTYGYQYGSQWLYFPVWCVCVWFIGLMDSSIQSKRFYQALQPVLAMPYVHKSYGKWPLGRWCYKTSSLWYFKPWSKQEPFHLGFVAAGAASTEASVIAAVKACRLQWTFVLCRFLLAFGCGRLFKILGSKADLGALVLGMLIANHPKTLELHSFYQNHFVSVYLWVEKCACDQLYTSS